MAAAQPRRVRGLEVPPDASADARWLNIQGRTVAGMARPVQADPEVFEMDNVSLRSVHAFGGCTLFNGEELFQKHLHPLMEIGSFMHRDMKTVSMNECIVLYQGPYTCNYLHYCSETLSKFFFVEQLAWKFGIRRVLYVPNIRSGIDSQFVPLYSASVTKRLHGLEILPAAHDTEYRIGLAIVVGRVVYSGHPTTWMFDFYRRVLGLRGGALAGRRTYIVRQDYGSERQIENHDELLAMLGDRGFQEMSCHRSTLMEQAVAFNESEVVLGVHGAHFDNLKFSTGCTSAVELMPDGEACAKPLFYRYQCVNHGGYFFHMDPVIPGTNIGVRVDVAGLGTLIDRATGGLR